MSVTGLYRPRLGAYSAGSAGQADRPRWLRRLAVAAIAVLVMEVVYIPLFSPRFAVRQVVLKGEEGVAAQVAAKIRLHPNTNIFRAPVGLVERQAESVPAVREARADRSFWGRRVVVTLERREAMAVVRGASQAVLVDPTGVTFTIQDDWGWGLPELAAPHLSKGDTSSEPARGEIGELLKALRALGPDPRLRIARLSMHQSGCIDATLDSGAKVRLGSTDQLPVKTKLLATVIDQLGADKIEFLDLSDLWAAYWRPRVQGSGDRTGTAPRRGASGRARRP